MPEGRDAHVGKNQEEKRKYLGNIRHKPDAPTYSQPSSRDWSTDGSLKSPPTDEEAISPFSPTTPPSRLGQLVREYGLISAVAGVLIAVMGWMGVEVYSINREVGTLNEKTSNLIKIDSELKGNIKSAKKSLFKDIDRNSEDIQRLNRRIDSFFHNKQE